MLSYIRKLVYKMGFRPKPGTILFSPAMDLHLKAKEAFEKIDWSKLMYIPPIEKPYRLSYNCPTCNGWVWNGNRFVHVRKTEGMVCQTCGHDYAKDQ